MKKIGKMCTAIMIFCSLVQVVPSYADPCILTQFLGGLATRNIRELPGKMVAGALKGAITGFVTGAAGGILKFMYGPKQNNVFVRVEGKLDHMEKQVDEIHTIILDRL